MAQRGEPVLARCFCSTTRRYGEVRTWDTRKGRTPMTVADRAVRVYDARGDRACCAVTVRSVRCSIVVALHPSSVVVSFGGEKYQL